jgi:hypothetical protein
LEEVWGIGTQHYLYHAKGSEQEQSSLIPDLFALFCQLGANLARPHKQIFLYYYSHNPLSTHEFLDNFFN